MDAELCAGSKERRSLVLAQQRMARDEVLPLQAQTAVVDANRDAAALRQRHVGVLLDLVDAFLARLGH